MMNSCKKAQHKYASLKMKLNFFEYNTRKIKIKKHHVKLTNVTGFLNAEVSRFKMYLLQPSVNKPAKMRAPFKDD